MTEEKAAETPKKWKKTVIELTILSEVGDTIEGEDLAEIAYQIDEGDWVGSITVKSTTPLDEGEVKAALLEAGSDETFFDYD